MKRFVHGLIFLLLPLFTLAQSEYLHWEVKAGKVNDSSYNILTEINIQPGWHVYAETDAETGIDALQLVWDNENIIPDGIASFSTTSSQVTDPVFDNKKFSVFLPGKLMLTQKIIIKGTVPASLKVQLKGFAASSTAFLPIDEAPKAVAFEGGIEQSSKDEIKLSTIDLKNPAEPCGNAHTTGKSIWIVFLLGLGGGLIALLTPCVFPMIPVTVSFFTNRAANKNQAVKNGMLYGFFIFLIYVLASLPFHLIGNVQPEIFNNISTNAWLNIFFFIVFIIFAISFFGYFEITLPSGIAGKVDSKSGLSSVSGIFFMALTLVIVSFSCTGVILGTLLVGTASDGAWSLTAGMAGFGTALALPFALFAIFPNWLKSLPKSGGWLDTVKKVLAFVELALAFKFLSNADLVEHWGLLKREVFIGIWLLITLGLAAYLFGWLRLPHDYKGQKISTGRKVLGIAAFLFALYLGPGLTNTPYANLKLLSGFPPPLSYSIYHKDKGVEAVVINDFDKAVQLSKAQNKPILIDFTGWACVNCRKMEEQVWTEPEIASLINEKFILVSLYVDDRKKLPANDRFTYKPADGKEKDIITEGDKWATFQSENFAQVTQPLYAVLSPDGKLMTYPVGYTPDVKKYQDWLNCGLKAYDTNK
ncbi:cytochrome C biogenesis protein [Terrimonas sp.]|uniref:protein-disulfide reductase DsbD family protein n=1 Tax=Terrimonas sp. TaxID=1914338 RepID=UPI000D50838F|nr:thioredoxin family protein [Terrimonas sp.]PVD53370.1 cytochrome C biogenesis protein [Terrimonas sp.]